MKKQELVPLAAIRPQALTTLELHANVEALCPQRLWREMHKGRDVVSEVVSSSRKYSHCGCIARRFKPFDALSCSPLIIKVSELLCGVEKARV